MRPSYRKTTSISLSVTLTGLAAMMLLSVAAQAQEAFRSPFRVGERLTYNISFQRRPNVGYAEMTVVSRGKLGDREAFQIHSRVKTLSVLSAAFYDIDEDQTVFVAADNSLPLYISKVTNDSIVPKETTFDYLANPPAGPDLLTLVYRIRNAGGQGSFSFFDGEKSYTALLEATSGESVRVAAGEFDTTISTVESDYLKENAVKDFRVNFSNDEFKVPVLVRFRTPKGRFQVELSSLQVIEPKHAAPSPTPAPVLTPRPAMTPAPAPTPTPYINNQPLAGDLAFPLGETLDYRITSIERPVATLRLQARERRLFQGEDSLTLSAEIISVEPGVTAFAMGDSAVVHVNPETLAPQQIEIRARGALSSFNQIATFDQRAGTVTFGPSKTVDVPVGTHSILSLVYAIRSFNMKRSRDAANPVNDTRVAVFWIAKPLIFTLRPGDMESIDVRGTKVPAQLITISTSDPQLDQPNVKIWLGTDERRLPLRIQVGAYKAELFADSLISPK